MVGFFWCLSGFSNVVRDDLLWGQMFARLASGVSFGLYNTNIQGDRANDEYLSNLTFSPTLLGLERSLNPEVIFLVLRYVSDPSSLVEK